MLRILFLGDIVGPLGRKAVRDYLSLYKEKEGIDLVIANAENATHGHGTSHEHYKELLSYGVDIMTSGNHFFNCRDVMNPKLDFSRMIRPLNLDRSSPLKGTIQIECKGVKVRVTNLLGRVFINMAQSNPFYDLEKIIEEDKGESVHIVDFHAEATAEKRCLAEQFDGKLTSVIGTHTHVQTNDLRLLPKGTLFLTDAGMNGALDSVLGDTKEDSIRRTMTGMPASLSVPRRGRMLVNACMMDIDENKKVVSYSLINRTLEDDGK